MLSRTHNISAQQQNQRRAKRAFDRQEYDNQPDPKRSPRTNAKKRRSTPAIDAPTTRYGRRRDPLHRNLAGRRRRRRAERNGGRPAAQAHDRQPLLAKVERRTRRRVGAGARGSRRKAARLVRSLYGVRATCGGDQVIRRQRRFQRDAASVFSAFLSLAVVSFFYCLSASQRVRGRAFLVLPALEPL